MVLLPVLSGVIGFVAHLFWANSRDQTFRAIRLHLLASLAFFAFTAWTIQKPGQAGAIVTIDGVLLRTIGMGLAAAFIVSSLVGIILMVSRNRKD